MCLTKGISICYTDNPNFLNLHYLSVGMAESSSSATDPEEVEVIYTRAKDHKHMPADRADARAQPNGRVKVNLLSDYYPTPDSETFNVRSDGSLGEKVSQSGEVNRIINENYGSFTLAAQESFELATQILSEVLSNQANFKGTVSPDIVGGFIMNNYDEIIEYRNNTASDTHTPAGDRE